MLCKLPYHNFVIYTVEYGFYILGCNSVLVLFALDWSLLRIDRRIAMPICLSGAANAWHHCLDYNSTSNILASVKLLSAL